jgi:L,D-peptidoglycan transpeptidase YkuD (ErfK/YbiS/YcfS/YnhG family)
MKKLASITLALVVVASTAAVAGVHLVGGTPTSGGNTIPFWGNQAAMRWQVFWFQREIGEGGPVTKVEFCNYESSGSTGGTFNGCEMLLCHTGIPAITANFRDNYGGHGPVTVYSGTFVISRPSPNEWFTLFENPTTTLNYNNTDNLLIEVSWTSAPSSTNYNKRASSGGSGRVYAYNATASSGSVTANYAHYARLTIGYVGVAPTSLGRVKSIFK